MEIKKSENSTNKTHSSNMDYESFKPKQKSKSKIALIVISIIVVLISLGFVIINFVYKKALDYNNEQVELYAENIQAAISSLFSVSEYDAIPDKYKEHIYDFMEYNGY